jgi:hypothetical protein
MDYRVGRRITNIRLVCCVVLCCVVLCCALPTIAPAAFLPPSFVVRSVSDAERQCLVPVCVPTVLRPPTSLHTVSRKEYDRSVRFQFGQFVRLLCARSRVFVLTPPPASTFDNIANTEINHFINNTNNNNAPAR